MRCVATISFRRRSIRSIMSLLPLETNSAPACALRAGSPFGNADAMPFIVRAKAAEIVIVATESAKSDEMPGADIAHHLARHGAKVEVERIVSTEIDVASTILSHAADTSADLLVVGGYGHSRLREFILGGATRGILAAMTVPTLMSH